MLDEEIDEAKAQSELRELLVEQHQGKWICPEGQDEKAHSEWVSKRINRGIELTAILRGYVATGKPKGKSKTGASKSAIAAAITEDLLG